VVIWRGGANLGSEAWHLQQQQERAGAAGMRGSPQVWGQQRGTGMHVQVLGRQTGAQVG